MENEASGEGEGRGKVWIGTDLAASVDHAVVLVQSTTCSLCGDMSDAPADYEENYSPAEQGARTTFQAMRNRIDAFIEEYEDSIQQMSEWLEKRAEEIYSGFEWRLEEGHQEHRTGWVRGGPQAEQERPDEGSGA
jgi:hypothetical protein